MQNPTVHSHKILSNKIKTVLTDHFGSRFANQNILYFISAPYIPFWGLYPGWFFFLLDHIWNDHIRYSKLFTISGCITLSKKVSLKNPTDKNQRPEGHIAHLSNKGNNANQINFVVSNTNHVSRV